MAELTISSEEIRGAIERYVSSYSPEVSREEVGVVADTGDGIAHVEGLPSTLTNELLQFEDGTLGLALNLLETEIGVIVLGDYAGIVVNDQKTGGEVHEMGGLKHPVRVPGERIRHIASLQHWRFGDRVWRIGNNARLPPRRTAIASRPSG